MKTIELKTVPLELFGNKTDFSYKEFVHILMESPENPDKGASVDEIRKSMRVLDALEKSNGSLQLEDADFEYLLRRVNTARFTASNKVFVDFVDYFQSIQ